jgi:hypothetical protein
MLKTRFIALACLALAALMPASVRAETKAPDKVAFYFAAHEDDWQLFMNPSAFEDVLNGARKTVFVHVTAGDAGLGMGSRGRKFPYYLARENGAEMAIRFMADADRSPAPEDGQHRTFNGHSIYRVAYRHTVSYFLRVPDGNPQGTGYPHTGFQSLKRLASGENNTLAAIDGSTIYHGWNDFVATVRAILTYERGTARLVQINAAELDTAINPHDHADHLATAKAAFAAANGMSCTRLVSYVDYASMNLPPNLNARERDLESSVFAVTEAGVLAMDHGSEWDQYDKSFVGRNYFRVVQKAACGATTEMAAKHSAAVVPAQAGTQ